MVLGDIYAHIGSQNTYFSSGPGSRRPWRNSVRHNLSINECFVKRQKAPNGRGHFWAVHPLCLDAFLRGDYRRYVSSLKNSLFPPATMLPYSFTAFFL